MTTAAHGRRTRAVLLLLVAGLAAALLSLLLVQPVRSGGTASGVAAAAAGGGSVVTVEPVRQVAPGVDAPLRLTVTNGGDLPLVLEDLTVRVLDVVPVTGHECSPRDYVVGKQYDGGYRVDVPARGSWSPADVSTWPVLRFVDNGDVQDGCKGAQVQLGYTATGS